MVDTHSHLYDVQFDADRDMVVSRAVEKGVTRMLLPNIDLESIEPMFSVCHQYPEHCFPMMALHPTAIDNDFEYKLEKIASYLENTELIAIGETGIDL